MVAAAVDTAGGAAVRLRRGTGVRAVLVRQATGTFGVRLVGMGLTIWTQVLLARLLGTESYGLYFYALTCANFMMLPGKLGLDAATLRFVPAYRSQGASALLRGFLARTSQASLLASAAVAALAAVTVVAAPDLVPGGLAPVVLIAAASVPAGVLLQLYGARLQALKRVALAGALEDVGRRAFFAAALLLAIAGAFATSAAVAMALNLVSIVAALAVGVALLRTAFPGEAAGAPEYRTREWLGVGLSLCAVSAFHLVLNQADVLLLGALRGTTEAGIYGVASRLATLLVFGLAAVNAIAAPMISELWVEGRTRELRTVVAWAARGVTALCLPLAVVMTVWGREILGIFGEGFVPGHRALAILVVGQVVNAAAGSVANLLTMTGHQTVVLRVMGVSALVNVILNLLLIPAWGIEGAAVATAVTTLAWNVALSWFVWNRLGMRATAL